MTRHESHCSLDQVKVTVRLPHKSSRTRDGRERNGGTDSEASSDDGDEKVESSKEEEEVYIAPVCCGPRQIDVDNIAVSKTRRKVTIARRKKDACRQLSDATVAPSSPIRAPTTSSLEADNSNSTSSLAHHEERLLSPSLYQSAMMDDDADLNNRNISIQNIHQAIND
eukprot:Selendium_serpulae@DN2067_c0_g1_i2.p1